MRSKPLVVYGVALYSGFVTMGHEMLLGRALVPYFGGTIYTWGALIGIFLLGMAIGFWVGGHYSPRVSTMTPIAACLAAGGTLIGLTPLALEPASLYFLENFEDVRTASLLAAIAFSFLPAGLLAAISPICVRMASDDLHRVGTTAGRLSALNTFGSILGTIGTSFFLVPHMGTRSIFFLLGGVSVVLAIASLLGSAGARRRSGSRHAAGALAVAAAVALGAGMPAPASAQRVQSGDQLLEKSESEYNNIYVIKRGDYLFMNFGYRGSEYVESYFDSTKPAELAVTYTRYMSLGLIYAEQLREAAFIGLGGGRTASYLVRTVPELRLEVAEIDPEVIRLARKYFQVENSERLKITPQDGRLFLTRAMRRFDAVFVDAYRGPFVPFHLLTKEFFTLVKSRLAPGGVVVQNVEPTTMLLDSAFATIRSVFANVDVYEAGGNLVLVAYDGKPLDAAALKQRAQAFQARYKSRYDPATMLDAKRPFTPGPSARVLIDDFAPVEMLNTMRRHNQKRE